MSGRCIHQHDRRADPLGRFRALLGFLDTWQLVISTGTTIVTSLIAFVIKNTQNREGLAMNIKFEAIMPELKIAKAHLYDPEAEEQITVPQEAREVLDGNPPHPIGWVRGDRQGPGPRLFGSDPNEPSRKVQDPAKAL